jgi:mRNA-degrading endonuclease RelE of RelBE toxin-antitoxin system
MNKVIPTPNFQKKTKRLLKKFPSLFEELTELEKLLVSNPETGIHIASYKNNKIYKIRLASSDKGVGKSGGFRVISYLVTEYENEFTINLITIFDKSEEGSISKSKIVELIKHIFEN